MKNLFFLQRKEKRFVAVRVIALCILLTSVFCMFAGCNNDDVMGDEQFVNDGNGDKTVVNIMRVNEDGKGDAWKALANEYMAQNNNVVINFEESDDWGTYITHLNERPPTIFAVKSYKDIEGIQNKPMDLSNDEWVNKVIDKKLLSPISKDGKIYGVPLNIGAFGFVYNKDMFEAAGINAEEIRTFDDMKKAVETINAKIHSGELKEKFPELEAVFEFPGKDISESGAYLASLALNDEGEEGLQDATEIKLDKGNGLKEIIDLISTYSANASAKEKFLGISVEEAVRGGLAQERVAAVVVHHDCIDMVKREKEEVAGKLGMLHIPLREGKKEDSLLVGVQSYLCISDSASEEEKNTAKDFLNWMMSSEKGKNILVNTMNYIPAFNDFGEIANVDGISMDVRKYIDENRTIAMMHHDFPEDWGNEAIGLGVQAYLTGEKMFEDVINNAKKMWEDMRAAM